MSTIFKKIIDREIPAEIVYETDNLIAIKDVKPVAPIHILFIPKKVIATLNDISEEDIPLIGEIYIAIAKIAKQLDMDRDGYRVVSNCNDFGGQTVFHLHFHLIGGKKLGYMV